MVSLLVYFSKEHSNPAHVEDITTAPSEASEVIQINGVDAVKYVEDWIFQASFNQDADAAYNTMFYEKAFVAGGEYRKPNAPTASSRKDPDTLL